MPRNNQRKILRKTIENEIKKIRGKSSRYDDFGTTKLAADVRGKKFWIGIKEHQGLMTETGEKCCFNHIIGLPEKEHLVGKGPDGKEIRETRKHPMYEYEREIFDSLFKHRYIRVKKATGMGVTTMMLRVIAHLCVKDDTYIGQEMIIVTGPRQDLANDELDRLVDLFRDTDYTPRRVGDSVFINGCKITAYPSHTFDSARGLANCRLIFVDEADFFPPGQIEKVMTVLERYEAKSAPYVILNSTVNMPTGLYAQMDKGKYPRFETVECFYEKGIGKIFTEYEISEAKKMSSFEREYNGRYGHGEGNIFPYQFVDACTGQYDLSPGENLKVLAVDPAYGSSKFAIVAAEKIGDVIYIKEAAEYDRPVPSAMVERVIEMAKSYYTVVVDNSNPGLISELSEHGIDVVGVSFKTDLSKMTMVSSRMVRESKVRIHHAFEELIAQLKSVKLNKRGHPDKELLNFDLGDAFLMAVSQIDAGGWYWISV